MTTLARLAIAAILTVLGSSCQLDLNWGSGIRGNGTVIQENRNVQESFTVISASEGMNVFINQGNDFEITVEADENVLELIGTDVEQGELRIHAIENIGRATRNIYVTLPEITGMHASSGADIKATDGLNADRLRIDASSGGDIRAAVTADEITASCSSGADIYLSGRTNLLTATASSGSDIKARDLIAQIAEANASSGADIELFADESLKANASSGADIRYDGECKLDYHKSSSGSVRKF